MFDDLIEEAEKKEEEVLQRSAILHPRDYYTSIWNVLQTDFPPEVVGARSIQIVPQSLTTSSIVIVGAGGIGSWVTMMLSSLGCRNITVFDHDTVDKENIGSQTFSWAQVGQLKVDALEENTFRDSTIRIFKFPNKITSYEELLGYIKETPNILISAVDNMEFRNSLAQELFEYTIPQNRPDWFYDARMSLGTFNIYSFPFKAARRLEYPMPDSEPKKFYFKTGVFPQEEGDQEPCGARAIAFTGATIAAKITANILYNARNPIRTDKDLEQYFEVSGPRPHRFFHSFNTLDFEPIVEDYHTVRLRAKNAECRARIRELEETISKLEMKASQALSGTPTKPDRYPLGTYVKAPNGLWGSIEDIKDYTDLPEVNRIEYICHRWDFRTQMSLVLPVFHHDVQDAMPYIESRNYRPTTEVVYNQSTGATLKIGDRVRSNVAFDGTAEIILLLQTLRLVYVVVKLPDGTIHNLRLREVTHVIEGPLSSLVRSEGEIHIRDFVHGVNSGLWYKVIDANTNGGREHFVGRYYSSDRGGTMEHNIRPENVDTHIPYSSGIADYYIPTDSVEFPAGGVVELGTEVYTETSGDISYQVTLILINPQATGDVLLRTTNTGIHHLFLYEVYLEPQEPEEAEDDVYEDEDEDDVYEDEDDTYTIPAGDFVQGRSGLWYRVTSSEDSGVANRLYRCAFYSRADSCVDGWDILADRIQDHLSGDPVPSEFLPTSRVDYPGGGAIEIGDVVYLAGTTNPLTVKMILIDPEMGDVLLRLRDRLGDPIYREIEEIVLRPQPEPQTSQAGTFIRGASGRWYKVTEVSEGTPEETIYQVVYYDYGSNDIHMATIHEDNISEHMAQSGVREGFIPSNRVRYTDGEILRAGDTLYANGVQREIKMLLIEPSSGDVMVMFGVSGEGIVVPMEETSKGMEDHLELPLGTYILNNLGVWGKIVNCRHPDDYSIIYTCQCRVYPDMEVETYNVHSVHVIEILGTDHVPGDDYLPAPRVGFGRATSGYLELGEMVVCRNLIGGPWEVIALSVNTAGDIIATVKDNGDIHKVNIYNIEEVVDPQEEPQETSNMSLRWNDMILHVGDQVYFDRQWRTITGIQDGSFSTEQGTFPITVIRTARLRL